VGVLGRDITPWEGLNPSAFHVNTYTITISSIKMPTATGGHLGSIRDQLIELWVHSETVPLLLVEVNKIFEERGYPAISESNLRYNLRRWGLTGSADLSLLYGLISKAAKEGTPLHDILQRVNTGLASSRRVPIQEKAFMENINMWALLPHQVNLPSRPHVPGDVLLARVRHYYQLNCPDEAILQNLSEEDDIVISRDYLRQFRHKNDMRRSRSPPEDSQAAGNDASVPHLDGGVSNMGSTASNTYATSTFPNAGPADGTDTYWY
jgi:hypothetical protein